MKRRNYKRHSRNTRSTVKVLGVVFALLLSAVAYIAMIYHTDYFKSSDAQSESNLSSQSSCHIPSSKEPSSLVPSSKASSAAAPGGQVGATSSRTTSSVSYTIGSSIPDTVIGNWSLILVNPWNKLPDGFSVEVTKLKNNHAIDRRAYPDLQKMMDDARAEGLSPFICSSYRTADKQEALFTNKIKYYLNQGYSQKNAEKEAAKWIAIPGTSEHQTGLAVDIVATSYQILDEKQENTAEQKWLMENCWKYGFVLRFPADKCDITGINYEPWHYRYVGKEAAKEIYERGICLEEYLNNKGAV